MPRGIIIDRQYISFISNPKTPKQGAHPRLILRNGEVLDRYLTLQFRNFDFSGNMFSFYGLENNSTIQNHIVLQPLTITLTGEIGEKVKKARRKNIVSSYIQDKLNPISAFNSEFTTKAQQYINTFNDIVEKIDERVLLEGYKSGGTSIYNPKIMIKTILYGSIDQNFSSRRIAKATRENIKYIWLADGAKPDFRTIAKFRAEKMEKLINVVQEEVIRKLLDYKLISMETIYVDGTKIEANASRNTLVWKKNVQRNEQQLDEAIAKYIKGLREEWARQDEKEDKELGDQDYPTSGEKVEIDVKKETQEIADRINARLEERRTSKKEEEQGEGQDDSKKESENNQNNDKTESNEQEKDENKKEDQEKETCAESKAEFHNAEIQEDIDRLKEIAKQLPAMTGDEKKAKQIANKIEKDFQPRADRIKDKIEKLDGKNSCSTTDAEATGMRAKKDQRIPIAVLQPMYNWQIATENQFILGSAMYSSASDVSTMIPFLEKLRQQYGWEQIRNVVADAGYGSEENYGALAEAGKRAFVKYPGFDKEQSTTFPKKEFEQKNWPYDSENDRYTCPAGKQLEFVKESENINKSGYRRKIRIYQCESCEECQFHKECKYRGVNRMMQISPLLEQYKTKAEELLRSEEGIQHRKKRCWDVETVFGVVKGSWHFVRVFLRGKAKTSTEMGIITAGYNINKMANALAKAG